MFITKVVFREDKLLISYCRDISEKDMPKLIVADWRNNKNLMLLLHKLLEDIINKYVPINDIDWDRFSKDLKKYEERQKK